MVGKNIKTRLLKKQAEALFKQNKIPEAARLYERICKSDKSDIDSQAMFAISNVQLGNFSKAEYICSEALNIDPDHALVHHTLGIAYQRQGKVNTAVNEFKHAIRLRPDYANAHLFLANALAELAEYNAAETSYLKALELDPLLWSAIAGLGHLHVLSGRFQTAEDLFRKAMEIAPGNSDLLADLGNSLCSQGKQAEALPILKQAVHFDPSSYQANCSLGNLLTTIGNYDDAIKYYQNAMKARPNDEYATGALASILERRGEFTKARDLLLPFVETGTASASIAVPFAELAKHFDNHDEASDILSQALEDQTLDQKTRTDIHFRLGKLLDLRKSYNAAFEHYRTANELTSSMN